MTQLFISHAHKDRPLVDAFVDLLDTGLGISPREMFATSLEGMGIPSGVNFIDYIKSKIRNPKVIVLMLSPNYFDRQFCLCEMGAAWALANDMLPIIVPPANTSDINSVLIGVQLRRIDHEGDLNEIRDELISKLGLQPLLARWDAKRKQFLESLPKLLAEQLPPGRVDYEKYQQLQLKYEDSLKEIAHGSEQLEQLKGHLARYRECQDRKEILQLTMEVSPEWSEFNVLRQQAQSAIETVPPAVVKILAHEMDAFDTISHLQYWEEESLEKYKRFGYVSIDTDVTYIPQQRSDYRGYRGSGGFGDSMPRLDDHPRYETPPKIETHKSYSVNWEHPKINRAFDALERVKEFLKRLAPEDQFFAEYKEAFGHHASFHDEGFWKTHLGYK